MPEPLLISLILISLCFTALGMVEPGIRKSPAFLIFKTILSLIILVLFVISAITAPIVTGLHVLAIVGWSLITALWASGLIRKNS